MGLGLFVGVFLDFEICLEIIYTFCKAASQIHV